MNRVFNVDRALVDLLQSYPDEIELPRRGQSGVIVSSVDIPERLKKTFLAWPDFPPKHTIYVFCSVIHVNSAMVFLLAQHHLRHTGIELNVEFHRTSSSAVKRFEKATVERLPALVTVTEGTAKILRQTPKIFAQFMEVQHSFMKWAATEEIKATQLNRLQYTYLEHPTDQVVYEQFEKKHLNEDRQIHTTPIDRPPECLDILSRARGNEVLLINSFMGSWAAEVMNKPLFFLDGWLGIEKRFVYGNRFLWSLSDARGVSIANWLQMYMASKFEDPRRVIGEFVANSRLGKEEYTKLVRKDYFNA
jgi:hypothetical protein